MTKKETTRLLYIMEKKQKNLERRQRRVTKIKLVMARNLSPDFSKIVRNNESRFSHLIKYEKIGKE